MEEEHGRRGYGVQIEGVPTVFVGDHSIVRRHCMNDTGAAP